MNTQDFSLRHIGTLAGEATEMLSVIGKNSIDELINETMPADLTCSTLVGSSATDHVNRNGLRCGVFERQ